MSRRLCFLLFVTALVWPHNAGSEEIRTTDDPPPLLEQMALFYSQLEPVHVPTGILLEAGSIMFREMILELDGEVTEDLALKHDQQPTFVTRDGFNGAVADLKRSILFADEARPSDLKHLGPGSSTSLHEGGIPVTLAFIEYDTLSERPFGENHDGHHFVPAAAEPIGDQRIFVASTVQVDLIRGARPSFVLSPNDIITFTGAQPENLVFEIGADQVPVIPGSAFEIDLPTGDATIKIQEFSLLFSVAGIDYRAKGSFKYLPSSADPLKASSDCYDVGQIESAIPFQGERATINLRVYPAGGTVIQVGQGPICKTGTSPQLQRVLVVVDGFDPSGGRTQDSIYEDFGEGIDGFVQAGFDVVSVDYEDGRDYIQRNGLAIRTLLVDVLPQWLGTGASNEFVVVAGSMGGQTSRYGLRSAELAGEDHRTSLFIAIDSPFKGAAIPISLQAFLEFFGALGGCETARRLDGLNSPAAAQQLIKNRFDSGEVAGDILNPSCYTPSPYPMFVESEESDHWYAARPEFYSYYSEVDAMGLPNASRNVGIASGSGHGSTVWNSNSKGPGVLNEAHYETTVLGIRLGGVDVEAKTDHHEHRSFWARIQDPRCFFNGNPCHKEWQLQLTEGLRLDVTPGGLRMSPREIAESWNTDPDALGRMYAPLPHHGFVPTFSALNIDTDDFFYKPSADPLALQRSGFDAIWYEKCNAQHVEKTDGMWAFIQSELIAFLQGTAPVHPPLSVNPCGQPESGDPVAICLMDIHPEGPSNPRIVDFDGTHSFEYGDGPVALHIWDFDDGSPLQTGPTATHTYTNPQGQPPWVAHPTLTVVDNDGEQATHYCGPVPVDHNP